MNDTNRPGELHSPGAPEGKRILIVDDEEDVRVFLQAALEDAGFQVRTACDGIEAMEAVRREIPDLISLDLVMPRHSGAKFYHDLQKDKKLTPIPVLIVTGHARDELGKADFNQMSLSGPGVYLEKPVSPNSYVAAVRRLLRMESGEEPVVVEPSNELGFAGDGAVDQLRRQVAAAALSSADMDTLQRALDALRSKADAAGASASDNKPVRGDTHE